MKTYGLGLLAIVMVALSTSAVLAQEKGGKATEPAAKTTEAAAVQAPATNILYGSAIGAGLVIIGAAFGFGKIGAAALEGMARQPEVAGKIQPAMIVIAALLEGATFFALLVCLIK
jgi:F-type H+-transporting ATPase subunit c